MLGFCAFMLSPEIHLTSCSAGRMKKKRGRKEGPRVRGRPCVQLVKITSARLLPQLSHTACLNPFLASFTNSGSLISYFLRSRCVSIGPREDFHTFHQPPGPFSTYSNRIVGRHHECEHGPTQTESQNASPFHLSSNHRLAFLLTSQE